MKNSKVLLLGMLFLFTTCSQTDKNVETSGNSLTLDVSISGEAQKSFKSSGRLFFFLNQNPDTEPRQHIWPSAGNYIFATNIDDWNGKDPLQLTAEDSWRKTPEWTLGNIPAGTYYAQILWDHDTEESRINAPGNIHSEKQEIVVDGDQSVSVSLNMVIPKRKLEENEFVKLVDIESEVLSAFWKKPMHVKASVLLPGKYFENPDAEYPIRYNVAGYGGRYTRVNNLVKNDNFMSWWKSDEAPQIINVFLDGEGPFGDSYQMDSDNSGPYGTSLITELIPHIENLYRNTTNADTRFVDGCSTGGWVSLGLQLYYPDTFGGVFSYSPDAIEFENYQLINIYKDKNAYVNEHGYLRPVMRDTNGEPMMSVKDFIQYENVLGSSDTYLNSGGQFSAHSALYSRKGEDGLPAPLFDPVTGDIDHSVAEGWKKYDMKIYAKENWSELGPKLQGKVFIWMGDMDHFYLNIATRAFSEFLETTENPKSDAEIVFSPTEGHCTQYSHKNILLMIDEKIKQM